MLMTKSNFGGCITGKSAGFGFGLRGIGYIFLFDCWRPNQFRFLSIKLGLYFREPNFYKIICHGRKIVVQYARNQRHTVCFQTVLDNAEEYRALAMRAKDRRESESYERIVELYVEIAEELEVLIDWVGSGPRGN
jgi:hypothetical protein